MDITIHTYSKAELKRVTTFLKALGIDIVIFESENPSITKGNKNINPNTLFGIWADQPKTLEDIRKAGWQ